MKNYYFCREYNVVFTVADFMQLSDEHIAFNSLFNRYYTKLCVYCASFVGDKHIAEDLVQDVFVNVWMKLQELNPDETAGSYLYKAVRNACLQYLRHQKVEICYSESVKTKFTEIECIPLDRVITDTDPAEQAEIQTLYRQALDLLPAQTRDIFLYSRDKGMKYSEIAELMNLSIKSIEYHISGALKAFREILKDYL